MKKEMTGYAFIPENHSVPIETFDDHRVAMAFTVMGLGCDGIEILNPGCCKKTFENYFVVLDSLLKH